MQGLGGKQEQGALLAAPCLPAQPASGWLPSNPVPTGDLITTMTWDGARFVGDRVE